MPHNEPYPLSSALGDYESSRSPIFWTNSSTGTYILPPFSGAP